MAEKLTKEQQLTEELYILSELLDQFTMQQIESVPRIRDLFQMLLLRMAECRKNIRGEP